MKVELTDEEVTTILIALDNYRDQMETDFMRHPTNVESQQEAGSAEWCWQKLFCAQQKFRNSIADAIGEGEPENPRTSADVDPFDFKGLEY
tara:strand:+ start:312 stop:584 length:273 start_codon:yes stop_codon:yes gene_type:complete